MLVCGSLKNSDVLRILTFFVFKVQLEIWTFILLFRYLRYISESNLGGFVGIKICLTFQLVCIGRGVAVMG